jgi:hypothetical protein
MAAIALLFGVLWLIAVFTFNRAGDTSSGRIEIRLGDEVFNAGSAEDRLEQIAAGGPVLFPDLLIGGNRYIYLNHQGNDPLTGWVAFSALADGATLECAVQWQPVRALFTDPCTGITFPADGEGLRQYPAFTDKDEDVIIDLTPDGVPGGGTTTIAG